MANELIPITDLRRHVRNREEAFSGSYRDLDDALGSEKDAEIDQTIRVLGLDKYLEESEYNTQEAVAKIIAVANLKKQKDAEDQKRKNNLRGFGWLITPIWATILTFVFITWLGGHLQEASFNRNAVFDVKLERFREAQALATEIMFDVRDAKYRINADQALGEDIGRYDEFVGAQMDQLQRLEDIIKGFGLERQEGINSAIEDAQVNLLQYINNRSEIELRYIDELRDAISSELIVFLDNTT